MTTSTADLIKQTTSYGFHWRFIWKIILLCGPSVSAFSNSEKKTGIKFKCNQEKKWQNPENILINSELKAIITLTKTAGDWSPAHCTSSSHKANNDRLQVVQYGLMSALSVFLMSISDTVSSPHQPHYPPITIGIKCFFAQPCNLFFLSRGEGRGEGGGWVTYITVSCKNMFERNKV